MLFSRDALDQTLNPGQDDLVGTAAVSSAVGGADGQHTRHTENVPVFGHRHSVLLQPHAQILPPRLQFVSAEDLRSVRQEQALHPTLRLLRSAPEDLNVRHRVTQNHFHRRTLRLWETHQHHTAINKPTPYEMIHTLIRKANDSFESSAVSEIESSNRIKSTNRLKYFYGGKIMLNVFETKSRDAPI